MPGIFAFNRRWEIGSDDFVFPAFGELIIRIAWLVALASVLAAHNDLLYQCETGHLLRFYYVGTLLLLSIAIFLCISIIYISAHGTVADDRPRARLPCLLYVRTVLLVPDFVWIAVGTKWAFRDEAGTDCPMDAVAVVCSVVIVSWLLQLAFVILILLFFDPLGRRHLSTVRDSQQLWKRRCHLLCCCASKNNQTANAFENVAHLISDYFHGIEVVPSDIVAGLILVQRQQQMRAVRLDFVDSTSSTQQQVAAPDTASSNQSMPLWMTLDNAAHFMKFAHASYGWPFFVFSNILYGPCKLCCSCSCCACCYSEENVHADNCCTCNTSAVLHSTGIQRDDIVYANFTNRIFETVFYIAIDHQHQSVVIAVRGTLSLNDALTDLAVDADEVATADDIDDAKAHSGILRAAVYVASTIVDKQLLETAFQKAPGYRLVVTGHSLGAGTAAILATLLQREYSNVMCFAFSPPGWLVSRSLSVYMRQFVCSVIIGKDLVPRLGVITLDNFKKQMLNELHTCRLPKYRILLSGAWNTLCCIPASMDEDDARSDTDEEQRQPLLDAEAAVHSSLYTDSHQQQPDESSSPVHNLMQTALVLPGRILFLEESQETRTCCGAVEYRAVWAEPESFDEILVGAGMISDHLPDTVQRALDSAAACSGDMLPAQTPQPQTEYIV